MTRKILFLSFLISFIFSVSAQETCETISSQKTLNALRLSGLTCTPQKEGNCSYQHCKGIIAGYSKPVLVLVPAQLDSLRVHFHGHKLGVYPDFEKDLPSMVKAFGLGARICSGKEAVVLPSSSGKCADYDKELVSKAQLKSFYNGIMNATGNELKAYPFHASAHSGGGRVLGRMVASEVKIDEVTVFDGIYSPVEKDQIKKWYQKGKGQLNLYSVRGMSPHSYTTNLKQELKITAPEKEITIKNTKYKETKTTHLRILNRGSLPKQELKTHYDIVKETW